MTKPIDFWAYREQQLRALGSLPEPVKVPVNAPAEISTHSVPVEYNENRMRRLSAEEYNKTPSFPAGQPAGAPRLYVGELGGRYYKRTRADGTTYRDYTY